MSNGSIPTSTAELWDYLPPQQTSAVATLRVQVLQAQFLDSPQGAAGVVMAKIPGTTQTPPLATGSVPMDRPVWGPHTGTLDFVVTRSWLPRTEPSKIPANDMDEDEGNTARPNRRFARSAGRYLRSGAVVSVNAVRKRTPRPRLYRRSRDTNSSVKEANTYEETCLPTSLELTFWTTAQAEQDAQRTYLAEAAVPVMDWCVSQHVDWETCEPRWLPLHTPAGEMDGSLQVRMGFLPVSRGATPKLPLALVYEALCLGSVRVDPVYQVPASEAVGMTEEMEDIVDDGLTDSDADESLDEGSIDADESDTSAPRSGSDLDTDLPEVEQMLENTVLEEKTQQRRRLLRYPRLKRSARTEAVASESLSDLGPSDGESAKSGAQAAPARRRLGRFDFRSRASAKGGEDEPAARPQRRRRRRLRQQIRDYSSKVALGLDVVGLVTVDVVGARDLPRWANMTYTSFDMDPFVVISFNRKVYRTRVCRHTLNPVWKEKLLFHVRSGDANFSVKFAVYDWDKLSSNDYVGEARIALADLLCAAPQPDPATGLYSMEEVEAATMQPFQLPLRREQGDEAGKFGSGPGPVIDLCAMFRPYGAIRQRFWRELLTTYDTTGSHTFDAAELQQMLASLGSTLTRATIHGFYRRFGKDPEQDALTMDEAVMALEDELHRPLSERRVRETVEADEAGAEDRIEELACLAVCPLCSLSDVTTYDEMETITHVALCASRDWHRVEDIAPARFVTGRQAQRKWYTNVITKIGQGHYRLGANSANILVQVRDSGELIEEKMQMYVRLGIRLLYQGTRGRMSGVRAKRMLRNMSVKQGFKFDAPGSTRFIAPFIAFHSIDVDEMAAPVDSFATFNAFFCRKIRMELRPLHDPDDPRTLVSCADCRLMAFESVARAKELWIKGRLFSLERLLGSRFSAQTTGRVFSLVVFRLAPQDYHRFHIPADGVLGEPEWFEGEYYTVNPMAIRSTIDVYGENKRVVVPLHTQEFGTVYIVCIGAMMVGSIQLSVGAGDTVRRGDELGYFQFGGSTLVVLLEHELVQLDHDLLETSAACVETLVQVRTRIGRARALGAS